MAEYTVYGYLTISVVATVRARSEDDARKKAGALYPPALCHQCSSAGGHEMGAWTLNGWDDVPEDAIQQISREKT